MSNKPSSIIINKAKIDRIDPENVELEVSASVLDKDNDSIPKSEVQLIINRENIGNILSDSDGFIDVKKILGLSEGDSLSIQFIEAIHGVKSKVKIITAEEKKEVVEEKIPVIKEGKQNIKSPDLDPEGIKRVRNKFEENRNWLFSHIHRQTENSLRIAINYRGNKSIEDALLEYSKNLDIFFKGIENFNEIYSDFLGLSHKLFLEHEYPKLKQQILDILDNIKNEYIKQ